MRPTACTNCDSPHIAPCGPAHKATGLDSFCVACATFYDPHGNPATADEPAIREQVASSAAKHGRHDIAHIFRNGGTLN